MAAGLTLRTDALARFGACFEQAVAELADPGAFSPELATDGALAGEPVDLELVEAIDRAVWGQGFPAPLFADEAEVLGQRLLKERHLRVDLRIGTQTFAAIAFGRTEPLPRRALIAYRLNRNDWGGRASLQLLIEQVGAPR
jgi:single-stranded-DNA-specific exonuclease